MADNDKKEDSETHDEVKVHFGRDYTVLVVKPGETVGHIKERALSGLEIVPDPSVDYILHYKPHREDEERGEEKGDEGQDITDETQTLLQLLGGHNRHEVRLHLKKRPKGG